MYLCLFATIFYWFSFCRSSPTYTHTHAHETRASICNAHNYSTTYVKTKVVVFFILFLLPRGAQCVVGDGLRLQLWLWLWPLQPQQPQLAFNIFLTLMKRNEQIFLRTFPALAPLSNTFRCCLSLSLSLVHSLLVSLHGGFFVSPSPSTPFASFAATHNN